MASDDLGMTIPKIPQREIWKRTRHCFVSTMGNVKAISGEFVKQYTNPKGYKFITLGKSSMFVHTLVAMAFLGSKKGRRLDVHHKDQKKGNNRIENLEFLTHKDHGQAHKDLRNANEVNP